MGDYKEIRERAEGLYSAYNAISSIFFSMHRVNVQTNVYSAIKTTPTIQYFTIPDSDNYDQNAECIIRGVSSKSSCEEALRFVERSTLSERMAGKNHISMEFLSYAAELCKLHFFKEDEDENGELQHVIFVVEKVDEERNQAIINALSRDFQNVFWIDLRDGSVRILKMEGFVSEEMHEKQDQRLPYEKVLKEYAETRVYPEDRESFEQEISLERLQEVFKEQEEHTGSYRILVDGELHHYRYIFYNLAEFHAFVAGFRNMDDVIAKHLEDEKKRRKKEEAYQKKLLLAAEEARRANKTKTEFLLRMSHDIRTPLNGIMGMLDIAEHFDDDIEKQRECRTKIYESSKVLLELINEVLDMSKLESGEVVLEHVPFDLAAMAYEIFMVVEKQAEEVGVTFIEEDCTLPHTRLVGSPAHYKRLVMNILGNAIKYNRPFGKIYITCREVSFDGNKIVLETKVRDTGIGMSEEFQKRLFEPFSQENITARTKYGGTGLGMSITKSLVEKMGGTITFESKKDVGTTFDILIPFEVDFSSHENDPAQGENEAASIKGETVILAEDNELNLEIAKFLLEEAGVHVIEAHNGEEAVAAFRSSAPGEIAAILMDLMMPVMDGYEASRRIHAMERPDARKIPIIAMTANAFVEDRIATKNAGMKAHLAKPLEAKKVIRTIAAVIRESRTT